MRRKNRAVKRGRKKRNGVGPSHSHMLSNLGNREGRGEGKGRWREADPLFGLAFAEKKEKRTGEEKRG